MILRETSSSVPAAPRASAAAASVRLGVIDYLNVLPVYDWILRRQHAEGARRAHVQQGLQHRAGEPEDDEQRRDVADHDVLDHVHEQELLLADRVDRRDEHEDEEAEAGSVAPPAPGCGRRAAGCERVDAAVVGVPEEREARELDRIERPARQRRDLRNHAVSLVR